PEKLHLAGTAAAECNLFEARLKETFFQGDAVILTVELESGVEAALRLPNRHGEIANLPAPGGVIRLALHPQDTVILTSETSGAPRQMGARLSAAPAGAKPCCWSGSACRA